MTYARTSPAGFRPCSTLSWSSRDAVAAPGSPVSPREHHALYVPDTLSSNAAPRHPRTARTPPTGTLVPAMNPLRNAETGWPGRVTPQTLAEFRGPGPAG